MAKTVKVRTSLGQWEDLAINVPSANNPTFTGTTSSSQFNSTQSSGDEGGEINFAKAATNTTLNTGVTLDVYQDRVRLFETGGTNRGGYIDMSTLSTGVGTNLAPGLTLIAGSSFTAATTIDITNCFSSTYQNYLIVQEVTSTNADGAVLTYFLNGTTPATAGYYLTYQGLTLSNTVNNAFGSNVGYGYFGQDYTNSSPAMSIASTTIFSPFASTWTKWTGTSLFGNTVTRHGGGTLANTNSYNGVRFTASAGNITGTIRVYGYRNS